MVGTLSGVIASGSAEPEDDEAEEDFTKIALQVSFDDLANGATSAPDTSMYAHTLTFNGTAAISTAQAKFGTSSLTGSHVTVPMDAMFGGFDGEFGIEFFLRSPNMASTEFWTFLSCGIPDNVTPDYDSYSWRIGYTASGGTSKFLSFQWHEDGEGALNHSLNWSESGVLNNNQWYHMYFGRDASNRLRMYVDGDLKEEVVEASMFHIPDGSQPLNILGFSSDGVSVNAFMQYLRIAKGRSLYTGNTFTPPAAPPF